MDILSQFKSTHKIGFNGLYMMPNPLRDDKSYFLRDGIMINPNRRNSTIQSIMELKINQSVAPDGPSMPPPIKKEMWVVAGKQEGGAGRQSVVPAARLGTVVSRLVAGQEARPSSQSKLE
jgi:hypothetical protein